MQFTVNKDELLKALAPLSKIAPKVASMPILETVLVESKEDYLVMTATDMEVMLRVRVKSDGIKEGLKVCIDLKLMQEFVKLSNKSDITADFDVNEGFVVQIKIGEASCRISGFDGAEFPMMDTLNGDEDVSFSLPTVPLQSGLKSVVYACGNDDLRPVMMGINFRSMGKALKLCATNAHILSTYEVEYEGGEVDITIPKKAASVLSDDKVVTVDEVRFYESGRNYCAMLGDTMIYFRLLDAKYPNYEAVIPTENPIVAELDKNELLSGIKRVGLFANETTKQVAMLFEDGSVLVSASDIDYGKGASEHIELSRFKGDSIKIGFNGKFLVETLSAIEGDKVRVQMSVPTRAALFSGATDVHLGLVMPVMIND